MSIFPLPVFEEDADPNNRTALTDEEIYARLEPPPTIVVRFGVMGIIGEYRYEGDAKPGCGSKLVARTHRGIELVEMLTTTCDNSGCAKSVTRQEVRDYIENSGGKDFPFETQGRVLRLAALEDLNAQSALDEVRRDAVRVCKAEIRDLDLKMKLVEAEPILGGELLTFYYMADERVDFREIVRRLASQFHTRIEMRQVGARDEARLVADYERCGQHCCCKNFLKVLRPVSMKSAKIQKATLDPLKISGRCGRLMCCLRYEDQTYKELKARLPKRKTRVGTAEGPGLILDTKILVQLALVQLEHDGREIAVPIEELMDPDECPPPGTLPEPSDPLRGIEVEEVKERTDDSRRGRSRGGRGGRRGGRGGRSRAEQQDAHRQKSETTGEGGAVEGETQTPRRRRRGGRRRGKGKPQADGAPPEATTGGGGSSESAGGSAPAPGGEGGSGGDQPKRRRRRRRRGGRGRGEGGGGGAPDGGGGGGGGGES